MAEFDRVWAENGGGHHGQPHDPTKRSCILPFPDQNEFLSSLLDDPRIHGPVASICGEDFNYTSGDGNLYAGDTQWHSDGFGARPKRSIKMAFYLVRPAHPHPPPRARSPLAPADHSQGSLTRWVGRVSYRTP